MCEGTLLPAPQRPPWSSLKSISVCRSALRIRKYVSYALWQPSKVIVVARESVNAYSTSLASLPNKCEPPAVVPVTI